MWTEKRPFENEIRWGGWWAEDYHNQEERYDEKAFFEAKEQRDAVARAAVSDTASEEDKPCRRDLKKTMRVYVYCDDCDRRDLTSPLPFVDRSNKQSKNGARFHPLNMGRCGLMHRDSKLVAHVE